MRFVLAIGLLAFVACATKPAPITDPAPRDFDGAAAGRCTAGGRAPIATVTIKKDTVVPLCLTIHATQRLRVFSQTNVPVRVRVGGISFNVPVGKATLTDAGIGRYLALGGHYVSITSFADDAKVVVVK
jgi:hypothetical protein